jgi:hypothetical protein
MFRRRRRFHDLVERQLAVFEADESALLREARAADAAWTSADVEDSEQLYGDYQLFVDSIGERLHDIRETYAASLEDATADEYRASFDRAALKRFGRYASFLGDEG